jgi:hypothetical protein
VPGAGRRVFRASGTGGPIGWPMTGRLTRAGIGTTRGFGTGRRDVSPLWMISRVLPLFRVNFPKMPGMYAPEILDRA